MNGARPADFDDPMARILGLGARETSAAAWGGYSVGALALMFAALLGVQGIAIVLAMTNRDEAPTAPQEYDVQRDETPPPPPPPAPTTAPEAPQPHPVAHTAPPPPPAPAQAAKILAREPDPNEPVDLTGNTFVTGNAEAYAGGTTASNGTSKTAVQGTPAPTGVPGGTGPKEGTPDQSRAAALAGGAEWSCPFPPEADAAQIDEAYVTLQVDVAADGTPTSVRVVTDPGNGFGRESRRCGFAQHFRTALDRDGKAIAGTTRPFRVHFSR